MIAKEISVLRARLDLEAIKGEPIKIANEEVKRQEPEEMIKKEVLTYENISKYGWENDGNMVKYGIFLIIGV